MDNLNRKQKTKNMKYKTKQKAKKRKRFKYSTFTQIDFLKPKKEEFDGKISRDELKEKVVTFDM